MITYLYTIPCAECTDKDTRHKKVIEEVNFFKGQLTDEQAANSQVIGIPGIGEANIALLYTE